MKKIFITTIGILLSITGISYAAILDNYGTINGTANVSGSEFYIGSAVNKTLLINEKPSSCSGSSFDVSEMYRVFKTKNLKVINFNYLPKINFQVRAKGTTDSTSSPVKLELAFGYYHGKGNSNNENGNSKLPYLATTTVTLSNSMKNYSFSDIPALKIPKGIHSFFYKFTKICPPDDTSCSVSISKCAGGFYTKVGLNK